MASSSAPLSVVVRANTPAIATAANSASTPVIVAPFGGVVSSVKVIPTTVITGAATNNRTHKLFNRGQAGAGTTAMATRSYASGTNAAAKTPTAVALSGTAADLVVVAGDVLEWESAAVGTGIADPGCLVEVTIDRTQSE